jgi:hypothetical protein
MSLLTEGLRGLLCQPHRLASAPMPVRTGRGEVGLWRKFSYGVPGRAYVSACKPRQQIAVCSGGFNSP